MKKFIKVIIIFAVIFMIGMINVYADDIGIYESSPWANFIENKPENIEATESDNTLTNIILAVIVVFIVGISIYLIVNLPNKNSSEIIEENKEESKEEKLEENTQNK